MISKKDLLMSLFSLSLVSISTNLFADELDSALQNKAQAKQRYFQELDKLGPNISQEQISQVRSKTIKPAEAQLTTALSNIVTNALQSVREKYQKLKASDPKSIDVKGARKLEKPGTNTSEKRSKINLKETKPGKKGVLTPKESAGPERNDGPALDGSNVPQEIEFPGKSKK